jgi:type IV pilus assembly protein PilX
MPHTARFRRPPRHQARQSGVVLLFALIALVIMLVGSVAIMRSLNSSLFNVGNIAFKRDMSNQAERVIGLVLADMQAGGDLASSEARGDHLTENNYSAQILSTNRQGIPLALLDDDLFDGVGDLGNDIELEDQGLKIRYVVDRLCNSTGEDAVLGPANCVLSEGAAPAGGNNFTMNSAEVSQNTAGAGGGGATGGKSAVPLQVVYRVSIRVSGPRNTLSFFQTTFSL